MNSTGIVRKIDELGRIVIPKEIRNSLNIKESESLEIFIEEDKIILKKYYKMNQSKENIKKYLEIFEHLIDSNFIITDREKIIAATSKYTNLINTKINSSFLSIIEDRKQKINKNIEKLSLFENMVIDASYIITPIIVDADAIGAILCFKNNSVNDMDLLSTNILNYLIKKEY